MIVISPKDGHASSSQLQKDILTLFHASSRECRPLGKGGEENTDRDGIWQVCGSCASRESSQAIKGMIVVQNFFLFQVSSSTCGCSSQHAIGLYPGSFMVHAFTIIHGLRSIQEEPSPKSTICLISGMDFDMPKGFLLIWEKE